MTTLENPKRNPIAERFVFNVHNRKLGESISQYVYGGIEKIESIL